MLFSIETYLNSHATRCKQCLLMLLQVKHIRSQIQELLKCRISYKEEIEKQLKGVSPEFCVAFAARSALRILPLLAAEEKKGQTFWYWQDPDKAKHLLAILTAIRLGLGYSLDRNSINKTEAFAAADGAIDVFDTFDSASSVADIKKYYQTETQSDLQFIQNNSDIREYIQGPLWSQDMPENWGVFWSRFQQWIQLLDAGFDVWLDWYQERLDGKDIDFELLNKQVNIPAEIKDQGVKAVNAYLATLSSAEKQHKPLQSLYLVRTIFIGNGAAGKTSLIKALHGEPVIEGKEKMIPGIDIREWPVSDTNITAHFWDFGGQVMAHATHQFFCANAAYMY